MNEAAVAVRVEHMDLCTSMCRGKRRPAKIAEFVRRTQTPLGTIKVVAAGVGRPLRPAELEAVQTSLQASNKRR